MAAPPPEPSSGSAEATTKPIHSLVLDTGPLIKNDPPASVLLAQAEVLYTLPCIISEIRDPATRSRVETTLLPFVTLRSPKPDSLRFVQGFARRTGDLAVLSRPDLEVLALGYELECERNGGDWRLRNTPAQKGLNGRPGQAAEAASRLPSDAKEAASILPSDAEAATSSLSDDAKGKAEPAVADDHDESAAQDMSESAAPRQESLAGVMRQLDLAEASDAFDESADRADSNPDGDSENSRMADAASSQAPDVTSADKVDEATAPGDDDDDDDEDGWITPSNIKKQKAQDAGATRPSQATQKTLQAAILTSDYAMQNVALRINLNLVTPSLARITQVKNWVLRCHGCFSITKDTDKQFCPSCGQATLMRASCSTDHHGNFRVHLKKNFQWNKRGNVYSVPRPVHGSANGKLPRNAGGKNGWGQGLMLAEDQKEYTRASEEKRRARAKDLMDDDHLPGILSGERSGASSGGRIRVGAGRDVNSTRKH